LPTSARPDVTSELAFTAAPLLDGDVAGAAFLMLAAEVADDAGDLRALAGQLEDGVFAADRVRIAADGQ